jgi:hypothetical protein
MTTQANQRANVCSIDVGIKHLALCQLVVDDNRCVSIADWRVVDLSVKETKETKGTTETIVKCMRCKKRAAYTNHGATHSFCTVHVQQQTHWLTQKPYTQSFLQKQSVVWLQGEADRRQGEADRHQGEADRRQGEADKEKQEQVVEEQVVKEKQGTKKDLVSQLTKAVDARLLRKVPKAIKAHDIPLVQLGRQLKRSLDPEFKQQEFKEQEFKEQEKEEQEQQKKKQAKWTHVVLENQISPIATRMKTLQGMLMQYFIMRCDDVEIACVSSSNKLSWLQAKGESKSKSKSDCKGKSEDTNTNANASDGYAQHKRDAVAWCRLLLASNPLLCPPHLVTLFDTMKKKDDLADCLLQGLWYLVRELGVVMYDADTRRLV